MIIGERHNAYNGKYYSIQEHSEALRKYENRLSLYRGSVTCSIRFSGEHVKAFFRANNKLPLEVLVAV